MKHRKMNLNNNDGNWFIPADLLNEEDFTKIVNTIEETLNNKPDRIDDYVLVDVIDNKITIDFYRKKNVDEACKMSNQKPYDVIMDLMRYNNSEEGKNEFR